MAQLPTPPNVHLASLQTRVFCRCCALRTALAASSLGPKSLKSALWHKLEHGIAPASQTAPRRGSARETRVDKGPSPRSSCDATERPGARTDRAEANADEETAEEDRNRVCRLGTP